MKTNLEISEFLSKKENWTKELIYVHKTRLLLGFFLGTAIGFCATSIYFLTK